MSLRKLKHHEEKLLKKVDFLQWSKDDTIHEGEIMRRYHLESREEYRQYQKLCRKIQMLAYKLKELEASDPYRIRMTDLLANKLLTMGVTVKGGSLLEISKVSVSAFCQRRLPIVMMRLKMATNLSEAVRFVKQGHVRIGPNSVTDPAFLVTKPMEDFLTWNDNSGIKRTILSFNNQLDDYDNPQAKYKENHKKGKQRVAKDRK